MTDVTASDEILIKYNLRIGLEVLRVFSDKLCVFLRRANKAELCKQIKISQSI